LRTAPVGPELVALVITVMSFKGGGETLRPLSDSRLITSRVPEKY